VPVVRDVAFACVGCGSLSDSRGSSSEALMCTTVTRFDSSAIRRRTWINLKRCLVGNGSPHSSAYIYKVYSVLFEVARLTLTNHISVQQQHHRARTSPHPRPNSPNTHFARRQAMQVPCQACVPCGTKGLPHRSFAQCNLSVAIAPDPRHGCRGTLYLRMLVF
jgi:hypothetical protein